MPRTLLHAALLALLALPVSASAQATKPAAIVDCGAAGGGTVRGAFVRGGMRQRPIVGGTVRLPDTPCGPATSDDGGRFEFRNVPSGLHLPTATASREAWDGDTLLAAQEWVTIAVVKPGETIRVEVGLVPFQMLLECRVTPECAPLLTADPAALAPLSEAERLREALLRTAIAVMGLPPGGVACVEDDEAPAVVGALRARFGEVVPQSRCQLPENASNHTNLRDRETGRRARHVWAREEGTYGDLRLVRLGHYTGPLNAMEFRCVLARRDGQWVARACELVSIS